MNSGKCVYVSDYATTPGNMAPSESGASGGDGSVSGGLISGVVAALVVVVAIAVVVVVVVHSRCVSQI